MVQTAAYGYSLEGSYNLRSAFNLKNGLMSRYLSLQRDIVKGNVACNGTISYYICHILFYSISFLQILPDLGRLFHVFFTYAFSSNKRVLSSFDRVCFNSYCSRFELPPSAGMSPPARLLSLREVERLQRKTTKIMRTAITTTTLHETPIIIGRLDDDLDAFPLFPSG